MALIDSPMAVVSPQHNDRTRRRPSRWIGVATALMCALAGGAVWCLLALYARSDLIVLALPIALVVIWALRKHGFAGTMSGAFAAFACVAIACAYSLYLQAAAQVASLLGLPLRDALRRMDPSLAADIARADIDTPNLVVIGLALAIAVAGVLWRRRGESAHPAPGRDRAVDR